MPRTPTSTLGLATPFLKWVGGKSRYATSIVEMFPDFTGTYFEPFMGSAAVYFALQPRKATLSDANAEVVRAFQQVTADPELVMAALDAMENTRERYLAIRAQEPESLSDLQRAARLIYLNKTSFRGLWRVNKRGQMNTPYGAYDRPLYNAQTMRACSTALQGAEIIESDFESVVSRAGAGDLVYLDPPYIPLGGWADFKRYTPEQFNAPDHERLAAAMQSASSRGALVLMSNSDTPTTREIYKAFHASVMVTRRDINLRAASRASTDLILSNFEPSEPDALF